MTLVCRAAIIILALFSVVLNAPAQQARGFTEEVEELLKLEQALLDAIATGDSDLWARHLHDSCIIVVEDGSTRSKRQFLDELNPLPPGYVGRIRVTEPIAQFYGTLAVLSFLDDETLELYGQKIHTRYRQTDTWQRSENGEWQMISMKVFEIPKNPPPVSVSASVLEQYGGVYQLSPERICSVYVSNGDLFARKGMREPQQLFAETENFFFRKGDGRVNVIFRKNSQGVFEMVERREGEDLVWKQARSGK